MRLFCSIIFVFFFQGIFNTATCSVVDPGNVTKGETVAAYITNGDTLLVIELAPVDVIAPRQFDSRREARRYGRMVRHVKAAYPYARLAGNMFREYSEILLEIDNEHDRRKFTEAVEKQIRAQFEEDLKRLTFTQGLILIKLIDRETQRTSYDILKEFRGTFSAVFWQSLGRIFGFNLKTEYDPEGDDKIIEEIVQLIEAGLI
jgi:hypothetical protein